MLQFIRKRAWASALLGLGLSFSAAWPATPASPAANPASTTYQPDQIVMLRESGKTDRRCLIVSAKKQQDGSTAYRVKALDNGEILTIYDRKPAMPPVAQANASKPPVTQANATQKTSQYNPVAMPGVTSPPDVASAPIPKPAVPQPVAQQPPPKRGFFDRFFSKSPPPPPTGPCMTCKTQAAVPGSTTCAACNKAQNRSMPGMAQSNIKQPAPPSNRPGTAFVGGPVVAPPVVQEPSEPLPVGFGPQLPMLASKMRPEPTVKLTPMRYEPPVDPVRLAMQQEQQRTTDLKDALKNAERPSHRITAAEELCTGNRAHSADVRAAIMLAAQDDPAGCVRAACIRCLSHQGVRDTAFMTLLVSAQNDRDGTVREEAGYALQKATHK